MRLLKLPHPVGLLFFFLVFGFRLRVAVGIRQAVFCLIRGLSLIVQIFAFKSIRTILKSNVMKFPYGTGKLENFSSIVFCGISLEYS